MYSVCTVNKIFNIPYLRRDENNNLKGLYKNIQDYFIKLYIYIYIGKIMRLHLREYILE